MRVLVVALGVFVALALASTPALAQDAADAWLMDSDTYAPEFEDEPELGESDDTLTAYGDDPALDQDYGAAMAEPDPDVAQEAPEVEFDDAALPTGDADAGDDEEMAPSRAPDDAKRTPAPGLALALAGLAAAAGLARRSGRA